MLFCCFLDYIAFDWSHCQSHSPLIIIIIIIITTTTTARSIPLPIRPSIVFRLFVSISDAVESNWRNGCIVKDELKLQCALVAVIVTMVGCGGWCFLMVATSSVSVMLAFVWLAINHVAFLYFYLSFFFFCSSSRESLLQLHLALLNTASALTLIFTRTNTCTSCCFALFSLRFSAHFHVGEPSLIRSLNFYYSSDHLH